jgi:hypothetical protein
VEPARFGAFATALMIVGAAISALKGNRFACICQTIIVNVTLTMVKRAS